MDFVVLINSKCRQAMRGKKIQKVCGHRLRMVPKPGVVAGGGPQTSLFVKPERKEGLRSIGAKRASRKTETRAGGEEGSRERKG